MGSDKVFRSAELTVEIVDTLRRYPNSESGEHNYYIYFPECLIGGDTDAEYKLEKRDVDRFAEALAKVIDNGGISYTSGAMDYCVYNTLIIYLDDGEELGPLKWCGHDEEDDPNPINKEFYISLQQLIKQWH